MTPITQEQVVEVAKECGAMFLSERVFTFSDTELAQFAQHFYDLGREAGENTAENAECKYVAGLEAENARLKAEREEAEKQEPIFGNVSRDWLYSVLRYAEKNGDIFPDIDWEKGECDIDTSSIDLIINGLYTRPLPAQPAVPEGWQLVPKEPTDEMREEGAKRLVMFEAASVWPKSFSPLQRSAARNEAERAYLSMLAAAPKEE